mgnify:CR=1 FL=1
MRLDTSLYSPRGHSKGKLQRQACIVCSDDSSQITLWHSWYDGSVSFKTILPVFHIPIFQFYEHCKLEMQTNNIKCARGVPRKPARGSTLLGTLMPFHLVREWLFLIFIEAAFVHLLTSIHLMLHRRSSIASNATTTNSTITQLPKNLF